jgi:hypothetical protein
MMVAFEVQQETRRGRGSWTEMMDEREKSRALTPRLHLRSLADIGERRRRRRVEGTRA